jgi:hypothetical protein
VCSYQQLRFQILTIYILRNTAFEYSVYVYLDRREKRKYWSILTGLNTQYPFVYDQYPKPMTEAVNVLNNHNFNVDYAQNSNA